MLLEAEDIAAGVIKHLSVVVDQEKMVVAGSFRRRRETVHDLDILVTGDSARISERFLSFPQIAKVLSSGGTRTTVVLLFRQLNISHSMLRN